MSKLTSHRVHEVVMDCLFKEGEPTEPHVRVEGIVQNFGFHPGRLAEHRSEVQEWISQLPKEFLKSGGGGWSFLNLCNTADGEQWGEHPDMQALCVLAIGLQLAAGGQTRRAGPHQHPDDRAGDTRAAGEGREEEAS
jgi:hypothetical protein